MQFSGVMNAVFWGDAQGCLHRFALEGDSYQQLKVHDQVIRTTQLSDDCSSILTCCNSGTIAKFDAETLQEKWRYNCPDLVWSVSIIEDEVFVGVTDSTIIVLNAHTGIVTRHFDPSRPGGFVVATSPKRSLLCFDLSRSINYNSSVFAGISFTCKFED